MRFLLSLLAIFCLATSTVCAADDNRLFELRVYYANEGKLDALHERFRNHTVGLFEKHGFDNIGYWTPMENEENTVVYIVAFDGAEDRERAWEAFLNDPDWKKAYAKSIADGYLVRQIDSVLMTLTDFSPPVELEKTNDDRIFELRRYTAAPGRLDNLDTRFREHTLALFEKHGMTNLPYFHIADGHEGAGETLIYLLAHPSVAARNEAFSDFSNDPDWKKARAASEEKAGGSLTVPGGVTSQLLEPTDYSPIQ